jgi:hypothetical protein
MAVVRSVNTGKARFLSFFLCGSACGGWSITALVYFDSLWVDKTMCEKAVVECLAAKCMQEPSCTAEGVESFTYLYARCACVSGLPGLSPRWGRIPFWWYRDVSRQ